MPAAAQEPWSILAAIPEVAMDKEAAKRTFGASASVAFDEPPRPSVLTVMPHVSLPACLGRYPYVAAADPSGMILLSATQPFTNFSCVVSYHLCDAPTGKVADSPPFPGTSSLWAFTATTSASSGGAASS